MRTKVLVLLCALAVACASLPLKQRVSLGHQAARTALVAFDDAERSLCGIVPPAVNHCANPAAAAVGLTDAKHQALSLKLADAYDKDAKVSAAIIAWRANDPAPADLATLLTDASDALAVVTNFTPTSGLMQKATDWLRAVQSLVTLFPKG